MSTTANIAYTYLKRRAELRSHHIQSVAHSYSTPAIPPEGASSEEVRAIATFLAFKAALRTIYRAEGTLWPDFPNYNPYRVCFGDNPHQGEPTINSWDDHWFRNRKGIPIGDGWVTTAAGASQATLDTWDEFRKRYKNAFHDDVPAFHPINQDAFTLALMAFHKATDVLSEGITIPGKYAPVEVANENIYEWTYRVANRWASFRFKDGTGIGDRWGQHKHDNKTLVAWFVGEMRWALGYGNYFPVAKRAEQREGRWVATDFFTYEEGEKYKTSDYGPRTHPVDGTQRNHGGVDYVPASGAIESKLAIATESATVEIAGWNSGGFGNLVVLKPFSDPKKEIYYAHLEEILVSAGQEIPPAAPIGIIGTTGRSTGIHLHFQINLDGGSIFPHPYLQSYRKVPDYTQI
ncbi:MAG TPA: M23 family metallopeptidase [Trichocoleus sp.]